MYRIGTQQLLLLVVGALWFASEGTTAQSEIEAASSKDSQPRLLDRRKRTFNADTRVDLWTIRQIPYYFDSYYTKDEKDLIRQAANSVSKQILNVITFFEVLPGDYRYKIKITPYDTAGKLQVQCSTYPGSAQRSLQYYNEQSIVMTRGTNGCLEGTNLRQIMKYFLVTLGRRNEYQRGDRDNYITIQWNNIIYPNSFRLYTTNDANWSVYPYSYNIYDFCSITIDRPNKYANTGTVSYTINSGQQYSTDAAQLSQIDCQLVNYYYGGSPSACPAYNCRTSATVSTASTTVATTSSTTARPTTTATTTPTTATTSTTTTPTTATTSTTTPTTTTATTTPTTTSATTSTTTATTTTPTPETTSASTTTTTPTTTSTTVTSTSTSTTTTTAPPCPGFCTTAPTESAFLQGPSLIFQTYLLFSGNCVAEYTMDWEAATSRLTFQTTPQPITSYFPAAGGPTMQPPVSLAYITLNQAGDTYISHFINQGASKSLECTSNPAIFTGGSICPTAAGSNGILPATTATSASSQLNDGDGKLYQYVVDGRQSEIKLMDETFTTTFQTTSGLLSGQTKIAKITAIQVMDDMVDFHESVMAIFGVSTDNTTPYVGFVRMPLEAVPFVDLTTHEWVGEPTLLKDAMTGSTSCS